MRIYSLFKLSSFLLLLLVSCDSAEPVIRSGYLPGAEGAEIYYQIQGTHPDTLVIIHGGPGAGLHSFSPSVAPLLEHFTLIQFDQRGGGASTLPENTDLLRPDYYVADLDSVRAFFGLQQMDVIAHSFGAVLLAEYLTHHPGNVRKAFLHAATGPKRELAALYYRALAEQQSQSPDTALTNRSGFLFQHLLNGRSESPVDDCLEYESLTRQIAELKGEEVNYAGTICKASNESVGYYYQYTAQLAPSYYGPWDYTQRLGEVDAEVKVTIGERDSLGLDQQMGWVNSFKNASLIRVPGASKAALSDNPAFLVPEIVSFFKN